MALGSGPQLISCFSFSHLNSNTVKTFSDDGAQSVNYLYQNGYGEIVATTEDEVSSALALKSELTEALFLNENHPGFSFGAYDGSLNDVFNATNKIFIHSVQGATDGPVSGLISMCITYAGTPEWGFQFYYYGGGIYHRQKQPSGISDWEKMT